MGGKSLWLHVSRPEENAYLALSVQLSGLHIVPLPLFTHANAGGPLKTVSGLTLTLDFLQASLQKIFKSKLFLVEVPLGDFGCLMWKRLFSALTSFFCRPPHHPPVFIS